ncbi:MAG: bifunctional adenosylcobinamide kinase/adenosylcobinamide-phosphate guanylyltransferase [Acidimicrobiales bacterium]
MITFVLGGTRSGKSSVAEEVAARMPQPVTYVATMHTGDDAELAERVRAHRARRPSAWSTEEAPADLPALLLELSGSVLLDALGGWVASFPGMDVDAKKLCRALRERKGDSVVVSEEVGMGVHPSSEAGRRFRDALGDFNQAVAAVADEVLLVVAGRTLRLDDSR